MSDEQEGVSSRQLLAAFFAVVVLCAVFFSLGFFLGHKEGSPEGGLASEQVPSSSDAPAAVNSPAQQSESDPSSVATASPAAASSNQDAVAPAPAASNSPDSSATPTAAETRAPAVAPRHQPAAEQPAQPRTAQPVALQTPARLSVGKVPAGSLVQVAALANQQDASNMVSVLESRGYPALILTPEQARASDNLFRVVAGPYKTRAESEKARSKLAAEGFKPFIRP